MTTTNRIQFIELLSLQALFSLIPNFLRFLPFSQKFSRLAFWISATYLESLLEKLKKTKSSYILWKKRKIENHALASITHNSLGLILQHTTAEKVKNKQINKKHEEETKEKTSLKGQKSASSGEGVK